LPFKIFSGFIHLYFTANIKSKQLTKDLLYYKIKCCFKIQYGKKEDERMKKERRWNEELLKEVVERLEKQGFKFKKIIEDKACSDVMAESETTPFGNFLWLRAVSNAFIPLICSRNHKGAILEFAYTTIRKKVEEKFPLFNMGLYKTSDVNANEVAKAIVEAFRYYEGVWKNLMSEKELISLVNGAISKAEDSLK